MKRDELRGKYPDILKGCWEIAIGDGWIPIVERLLEAMEEQYELAGVRFQVLQIKQKFGGLRYYFDAKLPENVSDHPEASNAIKIIHDLVNAAESESYVTCEACGKSGDTRRKPSGYIITLCDECAEKEIT